MLRSKTTGVAWVRISSLLLGVEEGLLLSNEQHLKTALASFFLNLNSLSNFTRAVLPSCAQEYSLCSFPFLVLRVVK